MSAASNGEAYSARALISAGADINAKAVVGDTPLTLAIGKTADSAVAHLLLSQPGILFDKQCVAQVLRKGWDDVAALLLESSTVDYATPCQVSPSPARLRCTALTLYARTGTRCSSSPPRPA